MPMTILPVCNRYKNYTVRLPGGDVVEVEAGGDMHLEELLHTLYGVGRTAYDPNYRILEIKPT
jgi:hypothetical protein